MKKFRALLIVLLLANSLPMAGQQKLPPSKSPRRPTPTATTPTATPTFDTLLPSDIYKLYIEVRGVGQVVRSNSFGDVIDPVLKLAGPPKEFRTFIKWLNAHADEVATSRMFLATWSSNKKVPEVVIAIEFPSVDEATKFEPQLNTFLPKVLPPPTPTPSATPTTEPVQARTVPSPPAKQDEPPKPSFFLKRFGSLIVLTPSELNLKTFRPSGSKPLSEDLTFRTARNRFTTEQLFAFVDFKIILSEEETRKEEMRAEWERAEAERASAKNEAAQTNSESTTSTTELEQPPAPTEVPASDQKPPQPPELMSGLGSIFAGSLFGGVAKWPQAIGVAASLEPDSFDVRALLINTPGEKIDAVPLLPNLIAGPAVATEAPTIFPADTEFLVAMSLDLPQTYAAMSKLPPGLAELQTVPGETTGPLADLEKKAKIDITKDLLPLLGSEVALTMSMSDLDITPTAATTDDGQAAGNAETNKQSGPSPVIALSLRDKEGMRTLLPRIIEGLGFKGVGAFAKTERREDTEMISYGETLSYAFIKNFIVLSTDAKAVRHVVDFYLKQETLSSDVQFKNYNRWQPRQVQAQIYISPALMESYKTWANQPTTLLSDQTRDFMLKLGVIAHPVTYSLSTEGAGVLHEVHVPKDLVLMAIAGISEGSNPSEIVSNERSTISALYMISYAEIQYKEGKGAGSYGTIEQLIADDMVQKDLIENHGYKIELTSSGNKFEITAVPTEYGKTGKTSYYMDQTSVLRGADRAGAAATMSDRRIQP